MKSISFSGSSTIVLKALRLSIIVLISAQFSEVSQAQAQTPVNQPGSSAPATPSDSRYRIGPDDVLEIRVFNRPQLSRDAVRVDGRGTIRMPLIANEIRAACLTESELSEKLQQLYSEYLIEPQIDVFVKEFNSNPVSLTGAVGKPGRFQLQRKIRVMELITLAGGPTPTAGRYINIFRSDEKLKCDAGGSQIPNDPAANGIITVDLVQLLKGDEQANVVLQPGDIISVPEGDLVFVVGNVTKPMAIPLREQITLSYAVVMAGGYLEDTKTDKVRLIRQTPGSAVRNEIIVNLEAINRKGAPDVPLQAGDVVEVPVSSGNRFKRVFTYYLAPALVYSPVNVVR